LVVAVVVAVVIVVGRCHRRPLPSLSSSYPIAP
jgi:hypothetical protein